MKFLQLYEWVKDGNLEDLQKYFNEIYGSITQNIEEFQCRDHLKRTLFHWACYFGHYYVVEWMLENYVSNDQLQWKDMNGYAPIDLASIRGYSDVMDWKIQAKLIQLLMRGKQKLYKNGEDNPLHWACYYGNRELIIMLIDFNHQQLLMKNSQGHFPIDYLFLDYKDARYKNQESELFDLIVKKYMRICQVIKFNKAVFKARTYVHISTTISNVQYKLINQQEKKIDEDNWIADEEPPVAYHPEIYQSFQNKKKILVSFSAPVQKLKTENDELIKWYKIKQSPPRGDPHAEFEQRLLFWAAYLNKVKWVEHFLKRSCSPFKIDLNGQCAMHVAAYRGSFQVLKLIVESNYEFERGKYFKKNLKFDKNIVLNKLTKNAPSTAMHLAIEQEHYSCAKLLFQNGAKVNIVNYRNLKPYQLTYNVKVQIIFQQL